MLHDSTLNLPMLIYISLKHSGGWFNIKMPSYQYRKSSVEIRRSYDRLISTMGFPILIKPHLYIESGLWSFVVYVVIHACIDVWETYIRLQFWRLKTLFIGISIQIFSQQISNGLGRILKKNFVVTNWWWIKELYNWHMVWHRFILDRSCRFWSY